MPRPGLGLLGIALPLTGCSDGDSDDSKVKTVRGDTTCDGKIQGTAHITVWFHSEQSSEIGTLRSQVEEFNRAQKQVRVEPVPPGTQALPRARGLRRGQR